MPSVMAKHAGLMLLLRLSNDRSMTLEDALNELYQGRTNVAAQAARIGMQKIELQRIFCDYVSSRNLDEDIWQKDAELSWPYIT